MTTKALDLEAAMALKQRWFGIWAATEGWKPHELLVGCLRKPTSKPFPLSFGELIRGEGMDEEEDFLFIGEFLNPLAHNIATSVFLVPRQQEFQP